MSGLVGNVICSLLLLLLLLQGFKLGLCSQPPVGLPYSLLCLSNNCCIADTFSTLMARFDKLYKRK
jgi:tubulin epsilon